MEEVLLPMLKSIAASGPLAVALLIALRHQTQLLAEHRAEIKELHKEKESLIKQVLDALRELGNGKS